MHTLKFGTQCDGLVTSSFNDTIASFCKSGKYVVGSDSLKLQRKCYTDNILLNTTTYSDMKLFSEIGLVPLC